MKALMRNICDQLITSLMIRGRDIDDLDKYSYMRNKSTAVTISMIKDWYLQVKA